MSMIIDMFSNGAGAGSSAPVLTDLHPSYNAGANQQSLLLAALMPQHGSAPAGVGAAAATSAAVAARQQQQANAVASMLNAEVLRNAASIRSGELATGLGTASLVSAAQQTPHHHLQPQQPGIMAGAIGHGIHGSAGMLGGGVTAASTGFPSIVRQTTGSNVINTRRKQVPKGDYVCHKCGIPGHFIQDCPNNGGSMSDTGGSTGITAGYSSGTGGQSAYAMSGYTTMTNGMTNGGNGMGNGHRKIPPPGYVCRKCQQPGHFIQDCPNSKDHFRPPPDGYICRLCGVPGHWIQQCPTSSGAGGPGSVTGAPGLTGAGPTAVSLMGPGAGASAYRHSAGAMSITNSSSGEGSKKAVYSTMASSLLAADSSAGYEPSAKRRKI